MLTGVILLYGIFDKRNEGYKGYLDFIVKEVHSSNFDRIILCGGYTDPARPTISEALAAKQYLEEISKFPNFVLEDKSINTNQNLEFAAQKLQSGEKTVVYCDLIRKAKVIWLALHYLIKLDPKTIYEQLLTFASQRDLYKEFSYQTLAVRGYDFKGRTKEEMIGQSYASILDVVSLYDKEMEEMDIAQRKKDFGLKD